MKTRQDEMLDYITSTVAIELEGRAVVGRNLMRPNRLDIPLVSVMYAGDTPITQNMTFIDWEMTATTTVALHDALHVLDEKLLEIRARIHRALMSDQTLGGLTYVQSVMPGDVGEPEIDIESDKPTITLDIDWLIKYRAPTNSIEA